MPATPSSIASGIRAAAEAAALRLVFSVDDRWGFEAVASSNGVPVAHVRASFSTERFDLAARAAGDDATRGGGFSVAYDWDTLPSIAIADAERVLRVAAVDCGAIGERELPSDHALATVCGDLARMSVPGEARGRWHAESAPGARLVREAREAALPGSFQRERALRLVRACALAFDYADRAVDGDGIVMMLGRAASAVEGKRLFELKDWEYDKERSRFRSPAPDQEPRSPAPAM